MFGQINLFEMFVNILIIPSSTSFHVLVSFLFVLYTHKRNKAWKKINAQKILNLKLYNVLFPSIDRTTDDVRAHVCMYVCLCVFV